MKHLTKRAQIIIGLILLACTVCYGAVNITGIIQPLDGQIPGMAVFGQTPSGGMAPLSVSSGGTLVSGSYSGTLTDRSGTITTGGTAQQLAAANTTRRYLLIQNTGTVDEWISFTTATPTVAGAGCYRIAPGGTYESSPSFVSNQGVYIYCATTGTAWSASEG